MTTATIRESPGGEREAPCDKPTCCDCQEPTEARSYNYTCRLCGAVEGTVSLWRKDEGWECMVVADCTHRQALAKQEEEGITLASLVEALFEALQVESFKFEGFLQDVREDEPSELEEARIAVSRVARRLLFFSNTTQRSLLADNERLRQERNAEHVRWAEEVARLRPGDHAADQSGVGVAGKREVSMATAGTLASLEQASLALHAAASHYNQAHPEDADYQAALQGLNAAMERWEAAYVAHGEAPESERLAALLERAKAEERERIVAWLETLTGLPEAGWLIEQITAEAHVPDREQAV